MISKKAKIINPSYGDGVKIYDNAEVINSQLGNKVIVGNHAIIKDSKVESNISINRYNYLLRSEIGDYTYTGIGATIRSTKIGRFCTIAWHSFIGGGNHEFEFVTSSPRWRFNMLDQMDLNHSENTQLKKRYKEFGKCIIGNDVWIASNAIVLRNVTVGNGAIIGAGAVVTKDVEPYSIVAGVPAKKIKMRFDDRTIEELEKVQWWNWPRKTIRENLDLIYSTKIDKNVLEQLHQINQSL